MQKLVITLFITIFSIDHAANILRIIDSKYTVFQEFLSFIALCLVIGHIAKNKVFNLDIKYIILFGFLFIHLINGVLINEFSSGSFVAGIRAYFKYIPFFLLPCVYMFSNEEMSKQIKVLVFLLIIQFPVALAQKFIIYADAGHGGDTTRGTLTTSSFLTITLICGISILLSFYLKKKITFKNFIILLILFFAPTTINETKSTVILLPIAIFIPLLVLRINGEIKKGILKVFILTSVLLASFLMVYDALWGEKFYGKGGSVVEFYADPDRLKHYLAPQTANMVPSDRMGRIDKTVAPIKELYDNGIVELLVGLGIGSVTDTPIGNLKGWALEYREQNLVGNSMSYLLWEIGVLGVAMSLVLLIMIFKDAFSLSYGNEIENIIATGWLGVVPMVAICLFYKDIIPVNALMYLFWYFSGYVVSQSFVKKNFNSRVSYAY